MPVRIIKLPDVGEGVAEAEIAEWHVAEGDTVVEDQVLAAVATDKVTVEIPAPVSGTVLSLGAAAGAILAVGAELVRIEVAETGSAGDARQPTAPPPVPLDAAQPGPLPAPGDKPMASPAVRRRATEAQVDLRAVDGSGPGGRVRHQNLDRFLQRGEAAPPSARTAVEEIKLSGMRRVIAQRMTEASRRIAHFSYVEEVDVTALETLRAALRQQAGDRRPKLTLLPFVVLATVRAVAGFPQMNAQFDDEAEVIRRHAGVHVGIATQTPSGLTVPVLRHAEAQGLWGCAAEIARLSQAARDGTAKREDLTGSTITITSLGALGGIATTPIINRPEVAIIGINRIAIRPVWQNGAFVPRQVMNLSSSFDHRVIDGVEAASFIQRLKGLLEVPATIFVEA